MLSQRQGGQRGPGGKKPGPGVNEWAAGRLHASVGLWLWASDVVHYLCFLSCELGTSIAPALQSCGTSEVGTKSAVPVLKG